MTLTSTAPIADIPTAEQEIYKENIIIMGENIKSKNRIQSCIFTFWKNKAVDFTSAVNLPIALNTVLDETLDTATILLSGLSKKDYPQIDVATAFEPGTRVSIVFVDENGEQQGTAINMIVARDDCRLQRKDDTAWKSYRHSVQLVELTKELERLSVDTLTFTNPVPRVYDAEADAYWSIV